jgi:hypothetical protein
VLKVLYFLYTCFGRVFFRLREAHTSFNHVFMQLKIAFLS